MRGRVEAGEWKCSEGGKRGVGIGRKAFQQDEGDEAGGAANFFAPQLQKGMKKRKWRTLQEEESKMGRNQS